MKAESKRWTTDILGKYWPNQAIMLILISNEIEFKIKKSAVEVEWYIYNDTWFSSVKQIAV